MLANHKYCYPLTITDYASRYLIRNQHIDPHEHALGPKRCLEDGKSAPLSMSALVSASMVLKSKATSTESAVPWSCWAISPTWLPVANRDSVWAETRSRQLVGAILARSIKGGDLHFFSALSSMASFFSGSHPRTSTFDSPLRGLVCIASCRAFCIVDSAPSL